MLREARGAKRILAAGRQVSEASRDRSGSAGLRPAAGAFPAGPRAHRAGPSRVCFWTFAGRPPLQKVPPEPFTGAAGRFRMPMIFHGTEVAAVIVHRRVATLNTPPAGRADRIDLGLCRASWQPTSIQPANRAEMRDDHEYLATAGKSSVPYKYRARRAATHHQWLYKQSRHRRAILHQWDARPACRQRQSLLYDACGGA